MKDRRTFIQDTWNKVRPFFMQHTLLRYLAIWTFLSLLIGILSGIASAIFLYTLDWVSQYSATHTWLIALLPAAGLLIGWLYLRFGKTVVSGNNLLIETIHEPKGIVPLRMAPLVYIGTLVTHLFGGSAGREGTALQMSAAIADQFSNPFQLKHEERKILLIAALAAGFGSVFGTPLAGALFALEIFILGGLNRQAILPAFAAAIIADQTTRWCGIPHEHYLLHTSILFNATTLFALSAAGVLFGLCAASFSIGMHKATEVINTKISLVLLRPVLGALLIITLFLLVGNNRYQGLGVSTISESFTHPMPWYDFLFKILFTIVTLSSGFKGGEVTPLFFIGATLGSALSIVLPIPTEVLCALGLVAVFAGATHSPIASTVLAIEVFGLEIGLAALLVCLIAYLCSGQTGIYRQQLVATPKYKGLYGWFQRSQA